jgi:hypothetical protein
LFDAVGYRYAMTTLLSRAEVVSLAYVCIARRISEFMNTDMQLLLARQKGYKDYERSGSQSNVAED